MPSAYDRYRWSLDEEEQRVQDLVRELDAEQTARRSDAGLRGDLEGYDADRDETGAWPKHLEDWENERLFGDG